MKIFFVSGVDTNVGKTFLASRLVQTLQNQGIRSLAIKPIETGVQNGRGVDALIHLQDAQVIFPSLELNDINFYALSLGASPYVADKDSIIDLERIYYKIEELQKKVEILFVEGAGGLFAPIQKDFFMLDLAFELQERFDAKSIVVCDGNLGMIHRFMSAKFILDSKKLRHLFFVNIRNQDFFETINLPFMQDFCFETNPHSLAYSLLKE